MPWVRTYDRNPKSVNERARGGAGAAYTRGSAGVLLAALRHRHLSQK